MTVRFWMLMSMVDRFLGPVQFLTRYLEQGTSRIMFVVPPQISEGDLNKY